MYDKHWIATSMLTIFISTTLFLLLCQFFQVLIARLREYMEQKGEGEDVSKDESAMEVEEVAEGAPVVNEEPAPAATPSTPAKEPEPVATTPVKADPVKVASPVVAAAAVVAPVAKSDESANIEETAQPQETEEASNGEDSKQSDVAAASSEEAAKPAEGDAAGERKGVKRKRYEEEPLAIVEDEPEIDDALFCLDWYNSDLSLKIDKATLMSAEPLYKDGWGYVW
jgi:hypothetical protein